jgi:RimJ/RimL family protein N-acetyltransferase
VHDPSDPAIESPRLRLRRLSADSATDQAFMLELLNQRSFIENIADRGVRTLADASTFLRDGPEASYRKHGFGLLRIERRADAIALGVCGLLQRDYLDYPDLGYALLDHHAGQGYAREAASATLDWAWRTRTAARVVATTTLDNHGSVRLLQGLGFRFAGLRDLPGHAEASRYFELDAPAIAP